MVRRHDYAQLVEAGHVSPRPFTVRLDDKPPEKFVPMFTVEMETGRVTLDERPEHLKGVGKVLTAPVGAGQTKRMPLVEILSSLELRMAVAIVRALRAVRPGGLSAKQVASVFHGTYSATAVDLVRLLAANGLLRYDRLGKGRLVQLVASDAELAAALDVGPVLGKGEGGDG